jgi:hypothetical protein
MSASSLSTTMSGNSSNNTNKLSSNQMTIRQTYQKKIQLKHILLRPDIYIGLTELVMQPMIVYVLLTRRIPQRKKHFYPGYYKIFDEIVVNASDNKQCNPNMDRLKVEHNIRSQQREGHTHCYARGARSLRPDADIWTITDGIELRR